MYGTIKKYICPIILSSVATLSNKRHDFGKEFVERKTCFDFLYNFRLQNFSF